MRKVIATLTVIENNRVLEVQKLVENRKNKRPYSVFTEMRGYYGPNSNANYGSLEKAVKAVSLTIQFAEANDERTYELNDPQGIIPTK